MAAPLNPAFSYIKLNVKGKIPTKDMTGWPDFPRAAPADVRDWLARGHNIGVRTDSQSGVWVLDVDVDLRTLRVSPEWEALVAEHGELDTYAVKSPSGGIHYYFRPPEGVEVRNSQSSKLVAPEVDVRGTGGYVVAPGMYAEYRKSKDYPGGEKVERDFAGTYDVINDSPIAQTPDWLREILVGRQEKARAHQVRKESAGDLAPKVAEAGSEWDRYARDELNALFAQVDQLVALPEGQSMEILGAERGWERGSGFLTLATKIIEIARWPHTTVTVEQVEQVWAARVAGIDEKYTNHDWENALEKAGNTWVWGDQQRSGSEFNLFGGVPESELPSALRQRQRVATGEGWQPLDVSGKPSGWAAGLLFDGKKFLVEEARALINEIGPMAIDRTGALWTYHRGVYVYDEGAVLERLYHMLGNEFTTSVYNNTRLAVQATARRLDLTQAPNPGVMNFLNGTLEWRNPNAVPQPHTPDDLITTQFPFEWDPTAACPKFDHWLSVMLEPDQVVLAWKILGYMMLSGNPLQVAFMLYGSGSNGKSTFGRVIEHLVGDSNISAVALKDFNQRFSTSAMIGKIANIVGDIDSDYQMSTAALKQVTGADSMQFERKNRDAFRASLWATCLFSANKIPGTNDGSEGYAERWVPIHFKRKASRNRIEGFTEDSLFEEVPGIAAKAVAALRTIPLHQGSSRNAAFDLTSESALAAVEEFREASSSYYAWMKNYVVTSESVVMRPKELWSAYKVATGSRVGGANCPRDFTAALKELLGEPKQQRGLAPYTGIQRNTWGYRVTVVEDESDGGQFGAGLFSNAEMKVAPTDGPGVGSTHTNESEN